MNSRRVIVVILALGLMLASSVALAQQDTRPSGAIAGEWNITFTVQGHTASGTLVLAVAGETLTGRLRLNTLARESFRMASSPPQSSARPSSSSVTSRSR